jgi:serine protease Do
MDRTGNSDLSEFSQSLVNLVENVASGVVAVQAGPQRTVSGVCLPGNLLAISGHAVRRQERFSFHNSQGAQSEATLLGRDSSIDLAILKADGLQLQPLPASAPGSIKAGSLAVVVGMTADVGPSVSLGMVGAVGGSRRTWRGGNLQEFLRLDVNLYPSQFGAAVVNVDGQLIGMASPALSRHAVIAIPSANLQSIGEEIARTGRMKRGYLGVGVQQVTLQPSMTAKLPGSPASALILLSVEEQAPAGKAGLQIGDILLELDGKNTAEAEDLQAILRSGVVDKTATASILRGGELLQVQLTVTERAGREQ